MLPFAHERAANAAILNGFWQKLVLSLSHPSMAAGELYLMDKSNAKTGKTK